MTIVSNVLNNLQTNIAKISDPSRVDSNDKNTADEILHRKVNSEMLQSQQEILNFNDAVGYMQVADGVLSQVSKQTDELNKLSVASVNGALNSEQQAMINNQMQALSRTISQSINQTTFNGRNVFNNDFNILDRGISLNINTDSLDVTNQDSILEFQKQVDSLRSDIGSFINESNSNIDSLSTKVVNEANSKSNYEVDMAKASNEINKDNLNLNAAIFAQVHNTDALANQINQLLG